MKTDKREIRCIDCKEIEPFPEEWLDLNPNDQAYLEDGFRCERCQIEKEQRDYFNSGMAEMDGMGYFSN